jgi:hypothetical protein
VVCGHHLYSDAARLHLSASGRLDWDMSNVLKLSLQEAIRCLHEKGGNSNARRFRFPALERLCRCQPVFREVTNRPPLSHAFRLSFASSSPVA